MKYRVIGWTYNEDGNILDSGSTIGFAERNAIIDEIRKHKYLFSGWHHQESWNGVVPILNDGKKRCFSQRGWGGVMAEAYEHMGDYDYASFTFHQSIANDKLHFAPDDFDIDEYVPEAVENEHFKVLVSGALFEIAKTSNPFYLEDLDELRYIDKNDLITLCYNGEELTYVVKDIDRNIASKDLKNAKDLIKGKFKIIVTHKPESERELTKVPLFTSRSKAFYMFKEAMEEYDYDVIKEVIETFYIDYFIEESEKKETINSLIRFVREYSNNIYETRDLIHLLKYIDNYELFEEIANKTFETNKSIYVAFINYYLEKDINIDEHILKFANSLKLGENLYEGSINILLEAITLKPNNKSLRKKYYKVIKDTRHEGLPIMAGANLFKYLRKKERQLIELDKYINYDASTIMQIVEYLTYPTSAVKENIYPYGLPKIYETNAKIMVDGIKSYQKYIKEHFEIENIMEDIILHGIDEKCFEMDQYFRGEEYAAKYICALDVLTDFKYNLKEKALIKYSKYEQFKKEIADVYRQ